MACKALMGAALLVASLGVGAAEQTDAAGDPWEGFNRAVFTFNDTLDRYAVKPLAQGYHWITPDIIETGVGNFFDNLADVGTALNNLLQGKVAEASTDVARVVFNSTIGLAGVIDVATPMGLQEHDEDFGQTLGVWGMDSGPYLVLPFFGPSSVRDGIGLVADYAVDPLRQVDDQGAQNALYALRVLDTRVDLLKAEELVTGDRYIFIRDAYLQRRKFSISDGKAIDYDDSNF
ncbi:MlaA family lipoprotein [Marinobacterium arenosum]|uniref:MlaA family lipoprotein n=1 Tax=Marinobacterium arenosum TaxID=2862496 RepID=UPI001C9413C3|nr:VacJ family lipoprotein [Marinobacterium arenosum]MBY4677894.1 VacJ family lipoprotein [Marinobacterium arenosum]